MLKQNSLNHRRHESFLQSEGYIAKSGSSSISKPWSWSKPLCYLAREQRLLFIMVGMAIATLFFLLQPGFLAAHIDHPLLMPHTPHTHFKNLRIHMHDHTFETSNLMHNYASQTHSALDHLSSTNPVLSASKPGIKVPLALKRLPLRILVTGGAGFVGSHLVDRLIARGDSVIVLDNFFTGRKSNVKHHIGNPQFELIRHDVVEPILLEVDQIYHLACPASPVHYKHNPIKTIKINVMGTLNMLGLAKRMGARFLLTSTSEVYGDPLEHPQTEAYWGHVNPIGVRSCYDEGKRTAETLTMDYHRGANVEVRIARIFNTYGPRMCIDDSRVVSNFVAQALRQEPLTVYGDGKQTRSFQYVSDLVEGLLRLMESEHIGPFNLGNPGEFTMLELANVVKDVIDPRAQIEFRENTADDPHRRKPDITKAKELLQWKPKVPLREGLPLMVEDFRHRILEDPMGSEI